MWCAAAATGDADGDWVRIGRAWLGYRLGGTGEDDMGLMGLVVVVGTVEVAVVVAMAAVAVVVAWLGSMAMAAVAGNFGNLVRFGF